MAEASAPRRRIVVVGPHAALGRWSDDEQESHRAFFTLPHPRSGLPAYFLPYCRHKESKISSSDEAESDRPSEQDGLLELVAVKPDVQQRAWFLGPEVGSVPAAVEMGAPPDEQRVLNSVIGDGALHTLSPIDPLFLILKLLEPSFPLKAARGAATRARTLDDILEGAARHWCEQLRAQGISKEKAAGTAAEDWADVLEFGESAAARRAFERACDVTEIDGALKTYRLSEAKVVQELARKVDALAKSAGRDAFSAAPDTLGRKYWPPGAAAAAAGGETQPASGAEAEAPAEPEPKDLHARRKAVLQHVLPTWLSDAWVAATAKHMQVSLKDDQ